MKVCLSCHAEKALAEFCKASRNPDGHMWECRACQSRRAAAYYAVNREEILARTAARVVAAYLVLTCKTEGCENPVPHPPGVRGRRLYCDTCSTQSAQRGRRNVERRTWVCTYVGCPGPAKTKGGLCFVHFRRRKQGQDMDAPIRPHTYRRELGSKYQRSDGYVFIKTGSGRYDGWELEHVFVMERFLGHALFPGQQIHHRNANRGDNRIENLEVKVGNHGNGGDLFEMRADAQDFLVRTEADAWLLSAFTVA